MSIIVITIILGITIGCEDTDSININNQQEISDINKEDTNENQIGEEVQSNSNTETNDDNIKVENNIDTKIEDDSSKHSEKLFKGYKLIEVDGGDLSGHREPNVVVDVGFGDREY